MGEGEKYETVTTSPMGTGNKPDNPHVTDGVNQTDTVDEGSENPIEEGENDEIVTTPMGTGGKRLIPK